MPSLYLIFIVKTYFNENIYNYEFFYDCLILESWIKAMLFNKLPYSCMFLLCLHFEDVYFILSVLNSYQATFSIWGFILLSLISLLNDKWH